MLTNGLPLQKQLIRYLRITAVSYTHLTIEDRMIEREQDISQKERILEMLQTLNPHQKEIIYYRFEEGLSYEEIGTLMNMKTQSVQNNVQRAFKKLRETFSADDVLLFLLFFTCLLYTSRCV